jgi:hypothetical protein
MIEEIVISCKEENGQRTYKMPDGLVDMFIESPGEVVILCSVIMRSLLQAYPPVNREAVESALINAVAANLVGIDPTQEEYSYA